MILANSSNNRELVTTDGIKLLLKENIPEHAIYYNEEDYKRLISSNSRSLTNNLTIDQLAELSDSIIEEYNYPNLFELSSINQSISNKDTELILNDFVDLTVDKIDENREKIRDLYGKQLSYHLISQITSHAYMQYHRGSSQLDKLNAEEILLLATHPWYVNPTRDASNDAVAFTNEKFPNQNHHRNKADAFRHSIWNVLLAKNAAGSKAGRVHWADLFTTAHEHGSPSPDDNSLDNLMDYHNNARGRQYWNETVTESGALFWYKINIPNIEKIKNDIYSLATNAKHCDTSAKINNYGGLVTIPYTVSYPAP